MISIHVPREGHDAGLFVEAGRLIISIHVPREGHDRRADELALVAVAFQSTCPARGTTLSWVCAEKSEGISIHVPREGHDNQTYDGGLTQ